MPTKTTTKNSEGNFEPFNINDLPWEHWPGSDRFKRLGRYEATQSKDQINRRRFESTGDLNI